METKMLDALNDQFKKEIDSAHIYLGMSAWLDDNGLKGMASWMMNQYKEEMIHAMKIYHFIQERGEMPVIPQVEQPNMNYESAKEIFEEALAHEKFVTESINNVFDVASEVKDRPAMNLMNWYIDEQVEEESTAQDIVDHFNLFGEKGNGLLMLDQKLGQRPAPAEAADEE